MRILSVCLVVLLVAGEPPPDSFSLHSRYGKADIERFGVRPGITMTVEYGSDGEACFLHIQPRHPFIEGLDFHLPEMSMETTLDVLGQVVPPETRGRFVLDGPGIQSSCGGFKSEVYENLAILFGLDFCSKPTGVQMASVHFKRAACAIPCSGYVVNPQGEKTCTF
jgi:hypothetical protein